MSYLSFVTSDGPKTSDAFRPSIWLNRVLIVARREVWGITMPIFYGGRGVSLLVCIVPQVFEQEDRHYGLAAAGHALHDDRMPAVVLKAVEYGVYSHALVVGEFFVGGIFEKV